MMRTPDGHSRLELSRFLTPPTVADHRNAAVNALGYLRVMIAVDDLDETLGRLRTRGAQLVGEVVQYKDAYRLCYIRGPEGLVLGSPRSSAERRQPRRGGSFGPETEHVAGHLLTDGHHDQSRAHGDEGEMRLREAP